MTEFKTRLFHNENCKRNADSTAQYSEGEVKVLQSEFLQLLGFTLLWHLGFGSNQSSL